jgi:phosphate-selective porin OprO/OprP
MNKTMRTPLIALVLAGTSTTALAQTAEERIAALEAKIAALSGELAELKTETTKADQALRKEMGAKAALSNGRPTLTGSDGSKFAIRSVLQFDAASYDEKGGDLNSGTNFRRARLGIEGTFAKHWNYALMGEFGGGGGNENVVLNQAWIEYAGWKVEGLKDPVRVRIGAWATPTGLEDATGNTESTFLERAAIAEMVRNLAGGDGRSSVGVFATGERWYGSAVLTGGVAGVPAAQEYDEQIGYLARFAVSPAGSDDWAIHLGANVQGILRVADTAAGAAKTRQLRFRERPELRVDGTRLVDSGAINAEGMTAYGGELGFFYKNVQVSAEAFRVDVDRIGGSNPRFDGWYVQGAWTLTGERHVWSSQSGGFKGIKPKKAFNPAEGAWGAVEIAARYSVLDLNDGEGLAGTATPVGGIRGGEQEIATVVLNWHPNAIYRFQLQYQNVNVDRLNAAGVEVGQDANIISLRSQVAF